MTIKTTTSTGKNQKFSRKEREVIVEAIQNDKLFFENFSKQGELPILV